MTVLFLYLTIGLCAIVVQTTILRLPLFYGVFYDLLIPLVVFLSLSFPKRQGILVVAFLGLIMDLLSGGVFGLYITVYIWIFLSIRGLSKYFDVYDMTFQSVLIGVCVLGQHFIFWIPLLRGVPLSPGNTAPVLVQTFLGALTGPGILNLFGRLQTLFQARLSGGAKRDTGDFAIR